MVTSPRPFEKLPTADSSACSLPLGVPFTTADALAAGISPKVLRGMRRTGLLRTMLTGVYVDSGVPDSLDLRARALFKVAPAGSVVTDRCAAWLLGADILGPSGRDAIPPVDVFRGGGGTRMRRGECRSGTRTFAEHDLMPVGDLLTTTPLRTALDLGRLLRRYDAIAAVDALMRVGRLSRLDLTTELPRFRGARGVVQLRQLVAAADARAESPAESRTRLLLTDAGLPEPQLQWEVRNRIGVVVYRLDLAYPEILLAVEYDGQEFHNSAADRAHDEERRAYLRALGWTCVVLTQEHVYGSEPTASALVRAAYQRLSARR